MAARTKRKYAKRKAKPVEKNITEKTLAELKGGDVVGYAYAKFCDGGIQDIHDDIVGSATELALVHPDEIPEAESDGMPMNAIVEIRLAMVVREEVENPISFVPVPAKKARRK